MEVYKMYPAANHVESLASSTSVLFDSGLTMSAADSLVSVNRDVSDSCADVATFGDTRRMIHCLAEHVVYGKYSNNE